MHQGLKILLVIFAICLAFTLNCTRTNVDQLAGAKKTAEGASKAVSGDVIKTAEKAGKPEEKKPEETITPPTQEGGKDGGPLFPEKRPPGPPVTPIEGKITMDDLTYPIYNAGTGKYEKPKVGDTPVYTTMTDDPFPIVLAYYDQLLSRKKCRSNNNISDTKGPHHAEFAVDDDGAQWGISINETIPSGSCMISISKR